MLLQFTLCLVQSFMSIPFGVPNVGFAGVYPTPLSTRPALISQYRPLPSGFAMPRLVAMNFAADGPLRELGAQPSDFTPYDAYLASVRNAMERTAKKRASLAEVCRALKVARGFRYSERDPLRADPPSVTSARRSGDCKSKALWLYDQLGDTTALYVIGKIQKRAKVSHAWLYWRYEGRWWILDPTNRSEPIAADTVGSSRYVPYYSFARNGKYRHPATAMLVEVGAARVAGKGI